MKTSWKWLTLTALLGALFIGCQQEGPAEKAGEKIDHAVEQAGDQVDKAGDKMEDLGDKVQEKANQ
jgi:uncharacterized protein YjbJ (UPF0337 family)